MNKQYQVNIIQGDYLFDKEMLLDRPVELHVCRFGNRTVDMVTGPIRNIEYTNLNEFNVYLNCNEPSSSPCRETIDNVLAFAHKYDLILTSDVEILQGVDNAKLFPYGTTWLNKQVVSPDNKSDEPDPSLGTYSSAAIDDLHDDKTFSISYLHTAHVEYNHHRAHITGYKTRCDLWLREHEINQVDRKFYNSCRYGSKIVRPFITYAPDLPEDDKRHLYSSQFNVSIESSQVDNYFSEKLIDALITKTIPIYWGCSNIGDFFDTRGMIIVNSVDDIVNEANKITSDTYNEKMEYINKNFETAKEYARSFSDRVKEAINEKL